MSEIDNSSVAGATTITISQWHIEPIDMIERVARALYDLKRRNLPAATWLLPWEDIGHVQLGYREEARSAIEAMRTPTEAMIGELYR